MKKNIYFLALILLPFLANAQTPTDSTATESEEKRLSFNVDMATMYLWRGQPWGNPKKPVIQPSLTYQLTDKFTIGVWATTNFTKVGNYVPARKDPSAVDVTYDGYREIDLVLGYQANPWLNVTLSDYFWPVADLDYKWSVYTGTSSSHSVEITAMASLEDSKLKIPLTATLGTLIAGNDYIEDETTGALTRGYSTYAELMYTLSHEKSGLSLSPFVGATLRNKAAYYSYADTEGISFTNIGAKLTKEFSLGKITVPIWANYVYNGAKTFPVEGRNFFVFGLSLSY